MLWRQGDVFISDIDSMPEEAIGRPIPHTTLVHGEITGHTHRVEDGNTAKLYVGNAPGEIFLHVTAAQARIVHEEHGPIELPTGFYRVWRQREYSPEAIRHVYD